MSVHGSQWVLRGGVVAMFCVLATACSSTLHTAPIIERSSGGNKVQPPAAITNANTARPATAPATGEASGTTYTVKKGDTLYSIALEFGQDYREIAAWNQIDDVNMIKIGQTLRVSAPAEGSVKAENTARAESTPAGVVTTPVVAAPALESKPLTATPLPPVAAKPEAAAPVVAKVEPAAARAADTGTFTWSWPTNGAIVEPFVEGKNKGIDLAGKAGDPVLAAGDGKVVYAGNGLRGYGNLVIIKHNNDFLSAYAHNSKILVKEGDTVKRGSKIAEVGSSDTDRAKLHFEVRRQGKPVDPTKYLPGR